MMVNIDGMSLSSHLGLIDEENVVPELPEEV